MMTTEDLPPSNPATPGALAMQREPSQAAPQMPAGDQLDPKMLDLFDKVVNYTRAMLAEGAKEVLAAMKADPVSAAAEFGARSLRQVVQAAGRAGTEMPPAVVVAAGVQIIKDLAAAAEANGLIEDGEEEVFLTQALQQGLAAYARMDADEGLIDPRDLQQLQGQGGKAAAGPAGQPAGALRLPAGAA